MFLILAFLLWAVVWGFFHMAIGVAAGSGLVLHADAVARRPDETPLAVYLAIMAGGTGFLIVVAAGGMLRNLVLFPLSARAPETPAAQ